MGKDLKFGCCPQCESRDKAVSKYIRRGNILDKEFQCLVCLTFWVEKEHAIINEETL